jgi:hypothetical protein
MARPIAACATGIPHRASGRSPDRIGFGTGSPDGEILRRIGGSNVLFHEGRPVIPAGRHTRDVIDRRNRIVPHAGSDGTEPGTVLLLQSPPERIRGSAARCSCGGVEFATRRSELRIDEKCVPSPPGPPLGEIGRSPDRASRLEKTVGPEGHVPALTQRSSVRAVP